MVEDKITHLNGFGIVFIVIMSLSVLFLKKKYALLPLMLTVCFMTYGQAVVLFNANFTVIRVLIFFYLARIIIKSETKGFVVNNIDKAIFWWAIASIILFTISGNSFQAFFNRLGFGYNVFGLYIIFRVMINNVDDLTTIIKAFAIILVPLSFEMILEFFTGRNVFGILGGVHIENTWTRGGHFRAQGPFRHPILAGVFGASIVPLFISLFFNKYCNKLLPIIGILAATTIIFSSASGTPIIFFLCSIIGLMTWKFRKSMRKIRWLLLLLIICLGLVMKAPIYYLIPKVTGVLGGTSWHRANLMEKAFENIGEWWLVGTKYTAHWMPYAHGVFTDMADITNEYLGQGITGGLLTLFLFIYILIICFKGIGKSMKEMEFGDLYYKILIWSIGCVLFAHCVTFLSVTYFDQTIVIWYFLIATIANISINTKDFFHQIRRELKDNTFKSLDELGAELPGN